MSDPDINGLEQQVREGGLGWFGNRTARDNREPPEGIEVFFVLNDGTGNRIALRTENVRLVRLEGEGAPEVIEPQEGGLYPPESFHHDNGATARGYGVQINPENPPQQDLPEGSVDENGFINTSMWGTFVAWMHPDPNDPSKNVRFHPVEEGFQIRRTEPEQSALQEAQDYAASIYEHEGGADHAREITAQVLADYQYNGKDTDFPLEPNFDENGMIATVRDGDEVKSLWHDENGQEILLGAAEIKTMLSAQEPNDAKSNMAGLAAYAIDQVESGKMEPTQDRGAAVGAAQERTGAEQTTPALETLGM